MMVFINRARTSQDVYVVKSIECDLSTTPRYVTLVMYVSILERILINHCFLSVSPPVLGYVLVHYFKEVFALAFNILQTEKITFLKRVTTTGNNSNNNTNNTNNNNKNNKMQNLQSAYSHS